MRSPAETRGYLLFRFYVYLKKMIEFFPSREINHKNQIDFTNGKNYNLRVITGTRE